MILSMFFSTSSHADVCGFVTDQSDLPLPGIEVQLKDANGQRTSATSNAEGKICFQRCPLGTVQIYSDGGGIASPVEMNLCVRGDINDLHILTYTPPGGLVADCVWGKGGPPTRFEVGGTIRDEKGAPIRGAKILMMNRRSMLWNSTTAGKSGSYRFGPTEFGEFDLTVTATGFMPRVVHFREDACAGGPRKIDVQMFKACR